MTRTVRDGCTHARENVKNRNIYARQSERERERDGDVEGASDREAKERRRETEDKCAPAIE